MKTKLTQDERVEINKSLIALGIREQAKISIQTKISARESARDVVDLLSWPDGLGAQYADAFLGEMRKLLPMKKESAPKPEPKPEPIARLGADQIWHEGRLEALDTVPMQYLHRKLSYAEQDQAKLSAYLNHPDIESRRGSE